MTNIGVGREEIKQTYVVHFRAYAEQPCGGSASIVACVTLASGGAGRVFCSQYFLRGK